jgi:hypothetical protein
MEALSDITVLQILQCYIKCVSCVPSTLWTDVTIQSVTPHPVMYLPPPELSIPVSLLLT